MKPGKQFERDFSAEVVLVEPEIPQNTGNIVRTCAVLGCPLHLVEPLGFSIEDRYLRRAGLDYWQHVTVNRYLDLDAFFASHPGGDFYFFSKKAGTNYDQAEFTGRAFLFFGKETAGLPESLVTTYPQDTYRLPMRPGARSLNLSNAVAVVLYEAFRQNGWPGLQ